ncbi:hypothetical protein TWF481_007615 [Arthrobotrys musiformis]|uniref:Uncharacterized protein n=1 Tax=Arthrobotrys musiformis TaxID=47236 RepID=A0AAV9WE11_9PEZI
MDFRSGLQTFNVNSSIIEGHITYFEVPLKVNPRIIGFLSIVETMMKLPASIVALATKGSTGAFALLSAIIAAVVWYFTKEEA